MRIKRIYIQREGEVCLKVREVSMRIEKRRSMS